MAIRTLRGATSHERRDTLTWSLDTRDLLRPAVVLAVLALSAVAGMWASPLPILALLALLSTYLLLRQPQIGLLALVIVSLNVPFELGTGTASALNGSVLLVPGLLGLWVVRSVARRQGPLVSPRPFLPLVLFCLVAILSFAHGSNSLLAFASTAPLTAQLGALAGFLLAAAAFFVASQDLGEVRWLRRLTWLFLAIGAVYIAARLYPQLGYPITRTFFARAGYTGGMFWVWLVALAFGQAVYNRSLSPSVRWGLLLLVSATLYVGFFLARDWVSGWLPPALAAGVTLLIGKPRFGSIVAVGCVSLVLFSGGGSTYLANTVVTANDYSLMTRLEAWRIVGEMVMISPVIGLGPANYYWYAPLFPILGWNVSFNSHNNYVDIVAQTGVVGLLLFLWFLAEVGRVGLRLRNFDSGGFGQGYVYGALGGLAGTVAAGMLADWILPFVYNIGLAGFRASVLAWLFLGGLVALQSVERKIPSAR